MLPLTLLGMALAQLTLHTGSIWPAILVHAGMNLCNGVLLVHLFGVTDPVPTEPTWQLLLLAAVMRGACMVACVMWTKRIPAAESGVVSSPGTQ